MRRCRLPLISKLIEDVSLNLKLCKFQEHLEYSDQIIYHNDIHDLWNHFIFQEEYYCPGTDDPEDFTQCCDGGCCPVTDSKMTTGTIFVIALIILNVCLVLTIIILCRTQIKSSTLSKFRQSKWSRNNRYKSVNSSGHFQQSYWWCWGIKTPFYKTTQTAALPVILHNRGWAIINELVSLTDSNSFSRSRIIAQRIIVGWSGSEFQTENSSITLQKWSCEVWSYWMFENSHIK